MYVARFTDNPENDIARGWSGYMGHAWKSLEEALKDVAASDIDEDEMEVIQQRYINTWGERYEDFEIFKQEHYEDVAEKYSIVYDETLSLWRTKHHDGLSCFDLESDTIEDAINEARDLAQRGEIEWAGDGRQTHGTVTHICQVEGIENLHIFACEYTSMEL